MAPSNFCCEETLVDPVLHCLQSKLDPVFAEIVWVGVDLDLIGSDSPREKIPDPSIDSWKGRRVALMPLLGKPLKAFKKKRLHTKAKGKEDFDEVATKNGVLREEHRNGLLTDHHHRQKAKQM
ncbi:unnamed protein product [Cochlearia groenlandica]